MAERVAYHYTCADHGQPGISRSGVVLPNWHPVLQCNLAWFTDRTAPDRERTGLGMTLTQCDRMAFRFVVNRGAVTPWLDSWQRKQARSYDLRALEGFGNPDEWFVSSIPVPAWPDLSYKSPSLIHPEVTDD